MARLAGLALLKEAGIDLAPFEARSRWRRFEPDEILVDFDDLSTDVYFLISGEVRILIRTPSGKEVIFGEMRGGQYFGCTARGFLDTRSCYAAALIGASAANHSRLV